MAKSFTEKVWQAARKIPRGKVSTYQAIAKAIGKPYSARAVGNALNKSPGMSPERSQRVPCHRVIRADGSVGGFASGSKNKIALLKKEGIKIKNGEIVS